MTHTVRFTPEALDHLDKLEVDISGVASAAVASGYVDSIVDHSRSCKPFRTEAHGATIFDRACERWGFADV